MEESGIIPIQINLFINPATVWATELLHPQASEECRRLYELEFNLSRIVNSTRRTEFQKTREVDEDVAVRSVENEHKWHRGRITDCLVLAAGPAYKVFLVDHGITMRVKPHQIRDLPYNMGVNNFAHQAMTLQLEDLVPTALEYVPEKDRLKRKISAEWTNAAEKFVEEIKQNYTKAFFKEGTTRKRGNKRFGDLIIHRTYNDSGISLSQLLIENKFAEHCPEEFYRRYLVSQNANDDDAPVLCPSSFPTDSSSGRSSRCTPSPDCKSPMGKCNSRQQTIMSIEEFLEERQQQRLDQTPPKDSNLSEPKETATVNHDVEKSLRSQTNQLIPHESQHQTPAKPNKSSRMAMLAKFKEAPASSDEARKDQQESSSGTVMKSLPDPPANTLGLNFVPAGCLLKSGPKAKSSLISTSFREGHVKDLTRDLDTHKRVPKPESVPDLSRTRIDCSRKIPTEEMEEHEARPKSVPITPRNLLCNSSGTDRNVTQSSSSHSEMSQQRLKMLCGAKTENPQNNSSKFVTAEKLEHEARPISVPIISRNETDNSLRSNWNMQSSSQCDMNLRMLRDSTSSASFNQISADRFLARHVLLHGGFAPKPWMAFHDLKSNFTPQIETWLISGNFVHNILTLEKFMWPAILQRQNVVMISPPKSGKTSSYLIPLLDCMLELEQMPKGHGPLILILCSGSETADQIYSYFLKILAKVNKKIRINVAYGLATGKKFLDVLTNLINGCEVLITTPPFLLRIVKEYAHNYALDFQRLCHYVIDQADILMSRHLIEMKEIQSMIVAEQCLRAKNDSLRDPIQIIVSSEKWEPNLLSFSKHLRGNPLLCINDCYEACVYGKPDVYFHNTCTSKKPTQFLNVVKNIAGLHKVVVFCEDYEMSKLEEFLDNGCVSFLVARTSLSHLQETLSSWETSKYGQHYVLLTTDDDFDDTKIQDATCVVHYSLPTRDFFVKRLSAILGNLPNMFEKKQPFVRPEIHILRDETNEEQLPRIVQLMRRISDELDPKLLAVAEDIARRREKGKKISKPFCTNVKMFGHCWKRNDCLSRHVCIPDIDFTDCLPQSGLITMQVLKVHNACHLSVRLTEHSSDDGTVKKFPSAFLSLGTSIFNYFSVPENKKMVAEINCGDILALQTKENLFVRVQVEDIIEKDKFGKATYVQVKHLDDGQVENAKTYMLFSLPENIKTVPAQAIDLFLSGLLPADQDTNFGKDANMYVKELIQEIHKEGCQVFQGKIILSMTGSLWVDCLKVVEWLPHTHVYVEVKNINQCLLQRKFALENPSHMQKLYELTGRGIPVISPSESRQSTVEPKPQPTPCWAFLESDVLEDVSFSYAEDVSHIFIRRTKFLTLLDNLLKDVQREVTERKTQEDVSFHAGYICLATFEDDDPNMPKWHRVQLLSLNEDGLISAYYVDHGDVHTIDKKNLTSIPDWAITKLPFQAIECSLAGVSSTNSVDLLYKLVDDGAKDLKAKVCERRHPAKFSGGNHYIIALIDSSKPDLSIINKEFLAVDGVECSKEELKFLDFDINSHLTNNSNGVDPDSPDSGDDLGLDLSDLEFKEDDLSAFYEDEPNEFSMDGFDTCGLDLMVKDFQSAIPSVQELAAQVNLNAQKSSENVFDTPSTIVNVNKNVTPKISSVEDYYLDGNDQVDEDSDWEDDVVFAGRYPLPLLCSARPPQVKWFEDLFHVWMKLCITDVQQYFLKWSFDHITFSACVRGRLFHLNQQLRGIILPDRLQCSAKGFTVEIKMEKACSGVEWGRLFKSKRKFAWISRDLEVSAMSSDDSDVELSLDAINKEIRKLPLKKRRCKPDRTIKDKAILPDLSSDVERSDEEYDMIDSDECF